jgi:translation initiation factor 2B subunit (eIF-2B alpha/beta/delta family)
MIPEIAQMIAEIENDKEHGASFISREALQTMKLVIKRSRGKTSEEFLGELTEAGIALIKARPSMASITNNISRFMYEVRNCGETEKRLDPLKNFASILSEEIIKDSEQASLNTAKNGAEYLENMDVVMTCSYSSAVCQTFKQAFLKGKHFRVLALESKSAEGKLYGKIAAQELESARILVKVIPDDAIKRYISGVNKIFVGADSVFADGSLINGTPTYKLASQAVGENIPLYSVCETIKFKVQGLAQESQLEEGFDRIPPNLITGIITEKGILKPDEIIDHMRGISVWLDGLKHQLQHSAHGGYAPRWRT